MLAREGSALVDAEFHYRTVELRIGNDLRTDIWLLDMVDERRGRKS